MTPELLDIYKEAANGDTAALDFCLMFNRYAHDVDDLVDVEFSPELLVRTLVRAQALFSSSFYVEHKEWLQGVMGAVANTWADSVAWEREDSWKGRVANVIRLCGNDVFIAVAQVTGGWDHARSVSLRLREYACLVQND